MDMNDIICKTLITIVDRISETSMPINEFVIKYDKLGIDFKQYLIVCSNGNDSSVELPSNISVFFVGKSKDNMRNVLLGIINKSDDYVIHLHQLPSALLFLKSIKDKIIRNRALFTVHSSFASRNLKYKLASVYCLLNIKYISVVSDSAYYALPLIIRSNKKKSIFCVRNGVDFDRVLSNAHNQNFKDKKYNFIAVGRLIALKNQRFLIKVLQLIPNMCLTLVGDGNKAKLIKYAESLKVNERICFTGPISRDKVFSTLYNNAFFVSSSKVEGMPVSVLEAMSAGLIPILSPIKPHKEIANIVPYCECCDLSVNKWVEKISSLLSMSEEEFLNASSNIIKNVKLHFSLEKMLNNYLNIYNTIAREKNAK